MIADIVRPITPPPSRPEPHHQAERAPGRGLDRGELGLEQVHAIAQHIGMGALPFPALFRPISALALGVPFSLGLIGSHLGGSSVSAESAASKAATGPDTSDYASGRSPMLIYSIRKSN